MNLKQNNVLGTFTLSDDLPKRDLSIRTFDRADALGPPGEILDPIKSKLNRGPFAATFFLAVIAALELDGVRLDEL